MVMSYDILSDDLFDEDKKVRPQNRRSKGPRIKPFYIHLGIVIIVLFLLFYFLLSDVSLDFGKKDEGTLTLIGQLESFNESYSGNLELYSSKFIIETSSGDFDEIAKDINIENFSGIIYYHNTSIKVEGTAHKIKFGKNSLNINGDIFQLESTKKTEIDLLFDTLNLNFTSGTAKLDRTLTYDFKDSLITMYSTNLTMIYDGTFSFDGISKNFTINSPQSNLLITHKND